MTPLPREIKDAKKFKCEFIRNCTPASTARTRFILDLISLEVKCVMLLLQNLRT